MTEPMQYCDTLDPALRSRIEALLADNDVVIFMKGTKTQPVCGFSATVAGIFKNLGVDFTDINVLADQDMREGIKVYNSWPTIPQIFIKGEFIGGCDIARAMYQSGDLQTALSAAGINVSHG